MTPNGCKKSQLTRILLAYKSFEKVIAAAYVIIIRESIYGEDTTQAIT